MTSDKGVVRFASVCWALFVTLSLLSQTVPTASMPGGDQNRAGSGSNPRLYVTPTSVPFYGEKPPAAPCDADAVSALSHRGNGPADPLSLNDTTFVEDDDLTMDECRYRDQSPIVFTIPIDRYVGQTDIDGYLDDPDKLIQNGIVSSKAQLRLYVWDVDEDYGGADFAPEIDRVHVNGHHVGNLTGANKVWSLVSFEVDIRYIKFARSTCTEYGGSGGEDSLDDCHSSPTIGQNEIRIDIDTANTGAPVWAAQVDWGALTFEAARPVLFVHGMGGEGNNWDKYDGQYHFNFRGKFSDMGFITATTEKRLGGDISYFDNGDRLQPIVAEMRQRYGVDRINIVAYSKGGLDSRVYISSKWRNPDNDIETLITLASPHHGSCMADYVMDHPALAGLLGSINAATASLTETSAQALSRLARARDGVRYYTVAADSGQDYWYGRDIPGWQITSLPDADQRAGAPMVWLILRNNGQYRGENDFMVTVRSAVLGDLPGHNSSNTADLGTYDLNHHSIQAAEYKKGEQDLRIVNLITSRLALQAASLGLSTQPGTGRVETTDVVANDTLAAKSAASGLAAASILNSTIGQGQILDQPVGVDSPTRVVFSLLWKDGDLDLHLVDTHGHVITPVSHGATITYTEDRTGGDLSGFLSGNLAQYQVVTPDIGQWTARIIADPTLPGAQVDWVLIVAQDSDVTLSLTTDQSWYRRGDVATVLAAVSENSILKVGASIQARVMAPDASSQVLVLYDDGTHGDSQAGDGIHSNQFTPTLSGFWRLSANTSVPTAGGFSCHRTAVAELQVSSGTAAFNDSYADAGIDTNGDGLFDLLRITVGVAVDVPGKYSLSGVLYSSTGVELGSTNTLLALNAGSNVLALDFDGRQIANRGGQGVFNLRELHLIDENTTRYLQADHKIQAFTTKSYNNSQFQRDALALTGTASDFGTDTNANGKYDTLTVNVGIYVRDAGSYSWNARLVDVHGNDIQWYSGTGYLVAGVNTVPFVFDGQQIWAGQMDGPYYLQDLILWGTGMSVNAIEAATPLAYNYVQFERPPFKVYLPVVLKNDDAHLILVVGRR